MDSLAKYNQFRGSVAIAADGRVVYRRDVQVWNGAASKAAHPPIYRIGSITKMFTATLVMQAVEKHLLSLDDRLAKYYPQMPNAKEIRIRDLLAHRSGLQDYVGGPDFEAYYRSRISKKDLLKRIAALKPEAAPNTATAYCSTNFLLLGWILEDVYRMHFSEIVSKLIVRPLQLSHTYAAETPPPLPCLAPSYKWVDGRWQPAPKWGTVAGAAGNMVSGTDDLIRFTNSLVRAEGKLLSAASGRQMFTSYGTTPDSVNGYGFGTMSLDYEGRTAWGHGGSIEGYQSIVMAFEDGRTTICVIANGERLDINSVFTALMTGWYGAAELPSFQPAPAVPLGEDALKKFVGTYVDEVATQLEIRIDVVGGALTSFVKGQKPLRYVATDSTRFRDADNEIRLRFTTNDSGQAVMKYRQGGYSLEFIRQP